MSSTSKTKICETWKNLSGPLSIYSVSNLGRIKSSSRTITYKDKRSFLKPGKILKTTIGNHGYPVVNLGANGYHLVHRLVAEAFCAKQILCDHVDHLNSIRTDNRSENLQWVTQKENNKRQKINRGVDHYNSKLAKSDVLHIRDEFNLGFSYSKIAKGYGVSYSTIRDVLLRNTWANV